MMLCCFSWPIMYTRDTTRDTRESKYTVQCRDSIREEGDISKGNLCAKD